MKLIRNYDKKDGSENKQGVINNGYLLDSLLRLSILPKIEIAQKNSGELKNNSVGRYLLHVYLGEPDQFLAYKDQKGDERLWVKNLIEGEQNVELEPAREKSGHLLAIYSKYGNVVLLKMSIRSIKIKSFMKKGITFVLSKINSFQLKTNEGMYNENEFGSFDQSQYSVLKNARNQSLFNVKSNQNT
ncbi:MAG: hypothetical protein OEM52_00810 [bacterium]|nr:hypothetical protein [bacterium]